ncbi:glycosyltransferase family 2 protein [Pedobacter sp. KR3-3]|uniref:Glycosyltransferase family 2 protein n=1 Tax=Pedobacter albus TaxID=3113905 RepID=A0ABU7I6N3_9SPHI|nr:glycosyltransferase family 2 protein [Pedobacter sp. KR3-3]MEE1945134.1 glycosyltransferase family 2 protein [Pedobacter sp. KR3-3]
MEDKPLLSVCLLTYNHAPYIAQAIESVLMQQTDFKWELIISDDCSNDGTREIMFKYKAAYPDLITLILNEKNLGAYQHWVNLLNTPKSKYIAYFEGDDYWTSPSKLQKQVDFLEANPAYTFVGHHVKTLDQQTGTLSDYMTYESNPIRLRDTIFGPPIHTCSYVARNGMGFPEGIKNLPAGDDALICHWASKGLGHSIPEFMAVYRHSSAGTWSTLQQNEKDFRTFIIHLWIFKHYKPLLKTQAVQLGKEFLSIKKNEPANLKRLSVKNWATLLLPLSIAFFVLSWQNLKKWFGIKKAS